MCADRFSYYWNRERHFPDADEIGRILWTENYRSVNYRYNESRPCPAFTAKYFLNNLFTPAAIFRKAFSLEYQSCECDDYYETEAYAVLQQIVRKACYKVIDAEPTKES